MNKEKTKSTSVIKKIATWFFGVVFFLILLLATAPYLFKDKINAMITKSINEKVNATVSFEDVNLSLLRSFPLANLSISKLHILNNAPFKGDTLFYASEIHLKMSIGELFKDASEAMDIKSFYLDNSFLNIVFDENGNKNFDIVKEATTATPTTKSEPFSLNIEEYAVENLEVNYSDKASNSKIRISNIVHSGKGNFNKDILDLKTTSKANLSADVNGTNYLNAIAVSLDAVLGINLKNYTFTFKENKGFINQLPLEFDGSIQLVETGQLYDINFKTPTSSFKNMLGLIPAQYAGNLDAVKTEGDFDINGILKGTYSENTIPTFDISFNSKNALFKYDNLPKTVKNININATISNKTGTINDTYVTVNDLSFRIDEDVFNAKGNVKNIHKNPKISLTAKGTINLENIAKAYPIKLEKQLSGILKANVTTVFDMNSVEKGNYQNIKNSGNISLSNFKYEGKEVAKPFLINKATIAFTTSKIQLNQFDATTGKSDLQIKGALDNFYGFLFQNQVLKGAFNLESNYIAISDFLSPTAVVTKEKKTIEAIKIPSFLDCTINAKAKEVRYDNLTLSDVTGNLIVKDEKVNLDKLKMNLFGGNILLSGTVSTKENTPTFKMNLGLDQLNISNSFSQIEMLSAIAPIANTIDGKLNATIELSGFLKNNMTPDLSKLTGNLFGQLIDSKINADKSKLLSSLNAQANFLDFEKLSLDDVKTYIAFKDSKVTIKPFQLKHKDIVYSISGTHGFDQTMNYDVKAEIPAKYLGKEVVGYLSKLSDKDAKEIKNVPVNIDVTGSFKNPAIKTDLKQATKKLVDNLIEQQKNNLINKGKGLLNNLLKNNKN